jgi:hypothetical protein
MKNARADINDHIAIWNKTLNSLCNKQSGEVGVKMDLLLFIVCVRRCGEATHKLGDAEVHRTAFIQLSFTKRVKDLGTFFTFYVPNGSKLFGNLSNYSLATACLKTGMGFIDLHIKLIERVLYSAICEWLYNIMPFKWVNNFFNQCKEFLTLFYFMEAALRNLLL